MDITSNHTTQHINEFFANIGPNLAKKHPNTATAQPQQVATEHTLNYLKPFTTSQVHIQKIKTYKSSGMDTISSRILKDAMTHLHKEFTHLYNISVDHSSFPDDWKIATVIPIPKVSNPDNPNEL